MTAPSGSSCIGIKVLLQAHLVLEESACVQLPCCAATLSSRGVCIERICYSEASDGHKLSAYVARPDGRSDRRIGGCSGIFGVTHTFAPWPMATPKTDSLLLRRHCSSHTARRRTQILRGPNLQLAGNLLKNLSQTWRWLTSQQRVISSVVPLGRKSALSAIATVHHGLVSRYPPSPGSGGGYYGGQIAKHIDEEPAVPVMLHFGKQDNHIPTADVEKITRPPLKWRSSGMTLATDSTATPAPATTPPLQRKPASARSNFSRSILPQTRSASSRDRVQVASVITHYHLALDFCRIVGVGNCLARESKPQTFVESNGGFISAGNRKLQTTRAA